jgi:hypothetical protein
MTSPAVRVGVFPPIDLFNLIPQSPDRDLAVAGPATVRKLLGQL